MRTSAHFRPAFVLYLPLRPLRISSPNSQLSLLPPYLRIILRTHSFHPSDVALFTSVVIFTFPSRITYMSRILTPNFSSILLNFQQFKKYNDMFLTNITLVLIKFLHFKTVVNTFCVSVIIITVVAYLHRYFRF